MKSFILIFLTFASLGLIQVDNAKNVPSSLSGTNWTARFYYYHNNYKFLTDSTGIFEAGRVAWSCPVDTVALGIPGNKILYNDPLPFNYQIIDSVLFITFPDIKDKSLNKIFDYHSESKIWCSKHEYVYGKECLYQESRVELFN